MSAASRSSAIMLAALLAGGCARRAPVEVDVVAFWPAGSAEHIETGVVIPLEIAFGGLPGLEHVDSSSRAGVGRVRLTFARGVDLANARAEVLARLSVAVLPDGVSPTLEPNGRRVVARFAVESQQWPLPDLRHFADWQLRPAALTVPGVAEVTVCGGGHARVDLRADGPRLAALGVTAAELRAALAADPTPLRARAAESPSQLGVRRVALRGGAPVLVRDVAQIELGVAPAECLATRDGTTRAIVGAVIARDGVDGPKLAAAVRARLEMVASAPGHHVRWFGGGDDEVRWRVALPGAARPEETWRLAGALAGAAKQGEPASLLVEAGVRADADALDPAPGEAQVIVSVGDAGAEAAARIDARLHALPGLVVLDAAGAPAEALRARVLRVSGPDLAALRGVASAAAAALGAAVEGGDDAPAIDLSIDRLALARLGVPVGDVDAAVEQATGGLSVGRSGAGADALEIVLHVGAGGEGPEALAAVTLTAADGTRVPLSTVATVKVVSRPAAIFRHDGRRCLRVLARAPSGTPLPRVPLPPGVTLEWE